MFHWTPRRIVAHVKLCVLALMIQRTAEKSRPDSSPFITNRKLALGCG
jgi:hypothetical protein